MLELSLSLNESKTVIGAGGVVSDSSGKRQLGYPKSFGPAVAGMSMPVGNRVEITVCPEADVIAKASVSIDRLRASKFPPVF